MQQSTKFIGYHASHEQFAPSELLGLVQRAEAAGFLIDEGIRVQSALFERVRQKLTEIERLRAELRGMIADRPV